MASNKSAFSFEVIQAFIDMFICSLTQMKISIEWFDSQTQNFKRKTRSSFYILEMTWVVKAWKYLNPKICIFQGGLLQKFSKTQNIRGV